MTFEQPRDLTFYPYGTHLLEDVLKTICAEHGGITQSLLVSPLKFSEQLDIRSVIAQMPGYHRILLDPHLDIQYHLSGYGRYYEEALIRLAGEAIERYSLLVAPCTLADAVCYASYAEIKKSGRVIPFEYLQLFSEAEYAKLNRGRYRGFRPLKVDDVVGWVRCPSLFASGSEIWVPAQLLFVGYRLNRERGEVAFCPAFSTGTAAHTSPQQALQSALLEFIEIDALMLHWYTRIGAKRVVIDDLSVVALMPQLFGPGSRYEVLALDLRVLDNVDAHVLGAALINKRQERPFIMMGAQGHLDPARACYRGMMEAIAISFLGIYGPLYLPKEYLLTSEAGYTDLDTNVAFFASPERAAEKRDVIHKLVAGQTALSAMHSFASGDVNADTVRLIRQLSSVSEYGVYLDVTPPETRSRGWHVMRVFIPELLTMCVPGVPYSQHPRIKAHGGIRNGYPHPMP